jgi:hypothetical protein
MVKETWLNHTWNKYFWPVGQFSASWSISQSVGQNLASWSVSGQLVIEMGPSGNGPQNHHSGFKVPYNDLVEIAFLAPFTHKKVLFLDQNLRHNIFWRNSTQNRPGGYVRKAIGTRVNRQEYQPLLRCFRCSCRSFISTRCT